MYDLSNKINIVKMIFMEVPIEPTMFFRPFVSNVSHDAITALNEVTRGGANLSTEAIAPIAGRILGPSTTHVGHCLLPNGWKEKRYSVLVQFEIQTPFGVQHEIITGYTDYAGLSVNDGVVMADPRMAIHFNTHTRIRQNNIKQAGQRMDAYVCESASHVVNPVQIMDNDGGVTVAETLMRPVDTVLHQQREIYGLNTANTYDDRTSMDAKAAESKMSNCNSSRFLSNLLTASASASAANASNGVDDGFLMGAIANSGQIVEEPSHGSLLFRRIKDMTMYGNTSSVTMAELQSIWPYCTNNDRLHIIMRPQTAPIDMTDFSHSWGDNSVETGIAYILNQSIPAIIADALMVNYSFTMTNRVLDNNGMPIVATTAAGFVLPLHDQDIRIRNVELSLSADLHHQIISRGVVDYALEVNCTNTGSVGIRISINGGMEYVYNAPAYCSSLSVPILADNNNRLTDLSYDLSLGVNSVLKV